jgi:27-O-demethylrifamycin SV methyltransferase
MTEIDYEPAAHYDRVTAAWKLLLGEELHYGVFESGDEPLDVATGALTERMIDAARLGTGLSVLDVGCGTGAPTVALAKRFGVSVLGITTSEVGVEAARARAAASSLSGLVSFEVRDGTDNGLPGESFDRVWVLESSHLMRERGRLVSECARVLRPQGVMVLCDITRQREISFKEVRDRRDDFVTLRTAFGDARMEPLELYAELATSAGLTVERTVDLTRATLPTFDRWRANAVENTDEVRALIGDDGLDAFVRATEILERFWEDGTFGYGLLAAVKPA